MMRSTTVAGDFRAKIIAGTHTVLFALDCKDERRKGLLGFAFKREIVGSGQPAKWLRSLKVFQSVVPNPKDTHDPTDSKKHKAFYSNEFPVQSFLWGDYGATPGTKYRFNIMPMYGKPGALTTDKKDEIDIEIETEAEWKPGESHGVWFNRGAIAGQKFAEEFGNQPPKNINDPKDPTVAWLSRGLLEACLEYINSTPAGDALRVAAYELTYPPIINALKDRLDDGVNVQIVYRDTTKVDSANENAMKAAGLPIDDQKVTYRRSKTKIACNNFIVRLKGGTEPVEVWTGSTDFTELGFLGESNVGHRVQDAETARQYLSYWELVKADLEHDAMRAEVLKLMSDPGQSIKERAILPLFFPRNYRNLLGGIQCTEPSSPRVLLTTAWTLAEYLATDIANQRDSLRFIVRENPATDAARKKPTQDMSRVILNYGVPPGELYTMKNGKPTGELELDKRFYKEGLYRPKNDGFVSFVHAKFLLLDPLSNNPILCSGSVQSTPDWATRGDLLVIRGDARVADIYVTEFDRLLRYLYLRDVANELSKRGNDAKLIFLDETDSWSEIYFSRFHSKGGRRRMFFAERDSSWNDPAPTSATRSIKKRMPKTRNVTKAPQTTVLPAAKAKRKSQTRASNKPITKATSRQK